MSTLVAATPVSAFHCDSLGSGPPYPSNSPLESDQDPPFLTPTQPEVPLGSEAATGSVAVIPGMSAACEEVNAVEGFGEVQETKKSLTIAATGGQEQCDGETSADFLSTAAELIRSEAARLGSASKQSSTAQFQSVAVNQNGEAVSPNNIVANGSTVKFVIDPSPSKENGQVTTEMVQIGSTTKIEIRSPIKENEGGLPAKEIEIERATVAGSMVNAEVSEEAVLKDKAKVDRNGTGNKQALLNNISSDVQPDEAGKEEASTHGELYSFIWLLFDHQTI